MKKLVLAYPNLRWHKADIQTLWNLNPAVLCLLGKMVEKDVDVTIVDAQFYDLSIEEFINKIKQIKPQYVGISMLTSEYSTLLHLAVSELKKMDPNIKVIAGGVHVTTEYMRVISDPNIDYAVRGEGEYTFLGLIRHLNGNGALPSEGLVFMDKGEVVVQKHVVVDDLSKLPMPDYKLVNMNDYTSVGGRYGPLRPPSFPHARLVITRGCPVGCSFCQVESISGKPVRSPKPESVVDELAYLKDNYGITSFIIDDDNIVIKKKFFKAFLRELIERDLNLIFIIQAFAIFALDDEMLDLMKEAGCQGINVAIESGNQRVMNEIVLKPVRLHLVPNIIKKIKSKGIFVLSNFIIGFPGETWDEIRQTISFAENSGSDYVKIFVAVPLKGTKMWDMAEELDAFDISPDLLEVNWRIGQIKSDEWSSKDVSILRAYEWDRINFTNPKIRKRVADIWGMEESEISEIRKATRDAISLGFTDIEIEDTAESKETFIPKFRTDGGNLLIN
jgi:anaerobic magnesium-protoporphyrin IX monomethyl ester cyclase